MTTPEKFSTASAEAISLHYVTQRAMWPDYIVRVIIPAVVREVREECAAESSKMVSLADYYALRQRLTEAEAAIADAERKGAWNALTKLSAMTWAQVRPFPHDTAFDEMVLHFRDTHYTPAAPAGAVTHEAVRKVWPSLMELFDDAGKSLTYPELAALLALAAPQEGRADA